MYLIAVSLMVLLCLAGQSRGRYTTDDMLEEFYQNVRSVPQGASGAKDKCKRDILIVVDSSYSIQEKNYNLHVKEFLKRFISHPKLNVDAAHGAQIAMISFSELAKTKLLFNFGDYTDKTSVKNAITTKLNWKDLSGSYTFTSEGLKLANTLVFPNNSPGNYRADAADILIILTDGEPRADKGNETDRAVTEINTLHKKHVTVITIAIGSNINRPTPFLNVAASSSDLQFKALIQQMNPIMAKLVDASCLPIQKGECSCAITASKDLFVGPGQQTRSVDWAEPTLQCKTDKDIKGRYSVTNTPALTSPSNFGPGQHVITYHFAFKAGFNLNCPVTINVKACQCPSAGAIDAYTTSTGRANVQWTVPQPTCSVPATSVSPNVASPHAFSVGQHTITYQYTLDVGIQMSCDVDINVKACQCPSNNPIVAHTTSTGKANIQWTVPKPPNCPVSQTSVTPNVASPHAFPVGQHTITYQYTFQSGAQMSCDINVDVQACSCNSSSNKVVYVMPNSREASVRWTKPNPTCGVKPTSVTPNLQPGHSFKVGRHTITYNYLVGYSPLTCPVTIEVKIVPCQNRVYDPSTKVCCCGKLHTKRHNYDCCGRKYYNTATLKCCSLFYNIVNKNDSCYQVV